jgi:hypothetical protein
MLKYVRAKETDYKRVDRNSGRRQETRYLNKKSGSIKSEEYLDQLSEY